MREEDQAPSLDEQFRRFARGAGRDGAPLYDVLGQAAAGDRRVLGLLDAAHPDQRRPNLLLAAVHYLLLRGADDPLARFYPTVAEWRGSDPAPLPPPHGDPWPAFAAFCERFGDELAGLVATRSTQTNEVGRCTALLPALATVAAAHPGPLALVDLGASAGLLLLFDRYAYAYHPAGGDGPTLRAGHEGSPVLLEAELRHHLPRHLALPPVAHRAGVDLDPVDPADADRALWLLACQWPDHLDRFRRLRQALDLARRTPDRARVAGGNLLEALPALAAAAPGGAHLCVYHTWVAAYLDPGRQEVLAAAMAAVARARPVSWVFAEHPYEVPSLPVPAPPGGEPPVKGGTALVLVELDGGGQRAHRLADVHPHGRWLHWWGR